jgi:hypothetical protein
MAALIVAIVSALAAVIAVVYAWRLDRAVKAALDLAEGAAAAAKESAAASGRSASAAEAGVKLEAGRRHEELTPQFRVTVRRATPQLPSTRLSVVLVGPPELRHLDELTVTIQDELRLLRTTSRDGATPEQIAKMVWAPYQFTPSTDAASSADAASHVASSEEGMLVGEELWFILYRTSPPPWTALNPGAWQMLTGTWLRLRLEGRREGWEPWTLPCKIDSKDEQTTIEVPGGPVKG